MSRITPSAALRDLQEVLERKARTVALRLLFIEPRLVTPNHLSTQCCQNRAQKKHSIERFRNLARSKSCLYDFNRHLTALRETVGNSAPQ